MAVTESVLAALQAEPLDNGMEWAAEQTRRYVETDGEGHDRSLDGARCCC